MHKTTYHSKTNVGLLQRRTVISTVSSHSYNLTILTDLTVNNTFHQRVLVSRGRSGQHSEFRPHFIQEMLLHLELERFLDTVISPIK